MISIPRNKALLNDTINTRPFTISHLRCPIMPTLCISVDLNRSFFCIYACRRHRTLYFFYLTIPLSYFAFPDKVFNNVWQHGMFAEMQYYIVVFNGGRMWGKREARECESARAREQILCCRVRIFHKVSWAYNLLTFRPKLQFLTTIDANTSRIYSVNYRHLLFPQ